MSISWMVYALFVGSVLAVGAVAVDGLARRASLATRWVWAAALAALVILAVVAPRAAGVHVTIGHALASEVRTVPVATPAATISTRINEAREFASKVISAAYDSVESRIPGNASGVMLGGWGVVSAAMLFVLLSAGQYVAHERRRWPTARIAGALVRVTPKMGPAVIGVTQPEIVVPRWLLEKTPDEQHLVIVHESEHVAARDQVLMMAGWLIVALLPWHPAVWYMMSRLRLAIELDCDARVLRRGVKARSYGSLLIDIAGQCAGHRMGALALADQTSHLERRLQAMQPDKTRLTVLRVATLGAVAGLAILAACEAKLPTAAEVATMDVATAQRSATALMLPTSGNAVGYAYFVDGKPTTEAEARAIEGSRIASINMSKPKTSGAAEKATVEIITVEGKRNLGVSNLTKTGDLITKAPERREFAIPTGKDAPMIVLDGAVVPEGTLKTLRPEDIATVEVLKGPSAIAEFGAGAKLGVIHITTKKAAAAAAGTAASKAPDPTDRP